MIAANELCFALGKVEWHPVGFGEDRDGENQESDGGREPKQHGIQAWQAEVTVLPKGKEQPAVIRLVLDDVAEVEVAVKHQDRDNREAERDFVGNHLCRGTHSTNEGELRVRGPSGECDSINGKRGD